MAGIEDLKRIKNKGINIEVFEGFTVYSGSDNIYLGNHIKLADTLINAGKDIGKVIIDDNVFFGHRVMLLARAHDYYKFDLERQLTIIEQPIVIKQGAWICSNSIIIGGVTIGEHSVIAAGSVVVKDVPPYTVVGGNPAKTITRIDKEIEEESTPNIGKSQNDVVREQYISCKREHWGLATLPERLDAVYQHISQGDYIFDLGTGRGAYTSSLSAKGYKVLGLDINYYDDWTRHQPTKFLMGNAIALPFVNKVFDTTIAFEVLEHIPRPTLALKELARCTKNKLILSVPNCEINNTLRSHDLVMAHWSDPSHVNFFTKTSLSNFLTENGFEILEMKDCYRVSPNNYYWDSIKLPKSFTNIVKVLVEKLKLTEEYWSSILVVAKVPHDEIQ